VTDKCLTVLQLLSTRAFVVDALLPPATFVIVERSPSRVSVSAGPCGHSMKVVWSAFPETSAATVSGDCPCCRYASQQSQ